MIQNLRQKIDDRVRENEILANHTTFKIGGPAKYFYLAQNSAGLLKAVKAAEELDLPYIILGWGSNVLVSDNGFDGLVIKASSDKFEIRGDQIFAEAGLNFSRLVGEATKAGLTGLEKFAGIPGTFGGAIRGNAGAFGNSICGVLYEVETYKDGEVKKLTQAGMQCSYRDTILKHEPGVVLSGVVKLEKDDPSKIQARVMESINGRRKLPIEPSAGCIFKNVDLAIQEINEERIIKELDITLAEWQETTKYGKLPIGFIIDKLSLKEKTIGGAQVSTRHGSFIVNIGDAKAEHVMMLISDVKMRVRNQLGIQLQEEVQFLPI